MRVGTPVFERYTERARRVIFFGRYEACHFGSKTIETEHFLLGLLREDKNLTRRFVRNSSSIESIRKEIEGRTTIGAEVSTSIDLPLSNECKRILMYASAEQDWKTASAELQLFLETIVDAIKERLDGDDATFPIFEGFDWRLSLRGLRSGLSADEDWKFRWWLTLLLAEVLLGRFEQRVNS